MMFFLSVLICIAIILILLRPIWSRQIGSTDQNREIALYQDQLAEIDRDLERSVISDREATSARAEVERRLLNAARRQDEHLQVSSRGLRTALAVAVIALPALSLGLYLQLGSPDQPASPFSLRKQNEQREGPMGNDDRLQTITSLEAKIADNPEDASLHADLAAEYAMTGQLEKSLASYQQANRLTEGRNRAYAGSYAEIMVAANDGQVPETAAQIFQAILNDYPGDPQATYYLAMAKAQQGNTEEAIADLTALKSASPPNAPWLGAVNGLIAELQNAPSPSQAEAIVNMTAAEQDAMIEAMVGRLADRLQQNPDDLEGWRRLAQSYEVLGDLEQARSAHEQVLRLAPGDPKAEAFLENN